MATLTPATISTSGVDPAGAAASGGGDSFPNTGSEFVIVANGGGGDVTVTATTTQTVDGLAVADLAVVVPAGASRAIGPFKRHIYSATVSLSYSGVVSVTVKALRFTPAGS